MPTEIIRWPNARFVVSVADPARFPAADLPHVAVAGHSNVGKSSLLNALFGRRNLVKTSKSPGCTRLINVFEVDGRFRVVDLPGYGFARAGKQARRQWAELIEGYLTGPMGPDLVLVLLDIRHGPKPADLQLVEWLDAHGLIWEPVATKADKLSGNRRAVRLREMARDLGGRKPLATSSQDGRGIEELRRMLIEMLGLNP